VFEFVNEGLEAAQASICAGGRYDYLIEELGGDPTPGIGWAAGVERMAASSTADLDVPGIDLFVAFEDRSRRREILPWLALVREQGLRADTEYASRSLKGQLTQAKRLGARGTLVVGRSGQVLRRSGQEDVPVESPDEILELLA
jgi:histidyl-tRNA synthetase